jgi:hypothetical protein
MRKYMSLGAAMVIGAVKSKERFSAIALEHAKPIPQH